MPYHLQIAHEDIVVSNIEPNQRRIQPDISFSDVVPKQVRRMTRLTKVRLQPIQGLKQRYQIVFVRRLRGRKAGLVDPIIDRMINPIIHRIDLAAQSLGVEAPARLRALTQVLRQQAVKSRIEHPKDLATLIADNRLRLLVPQRRHGKPTHILRVGLVVQLAQLREAIQRVFRIRAMSSREQPAFVRELEVAQDELDDGFEAFEGADEIGSVRPGAAEVDVERVAVFLRRELSAWGGGDEGAELAIFAAELTVCVG